MTPKGNLCHGYQHRSWLWWGQRPRHGPWLQFKPKTTSWPAAVAQTVQLKIVLGWHGPQKPSPQVSFWPSVVAGAMGIDADHGCRRVTNSDMALGRSPGPDNTMSPGGKQASHTNLFFTALTSSDLSLSVAHGPLSAPFSPYPTIYSLPIMELIPTLSEQTALS